MTHVLKRSTFRFVIRLIIRFTIAISIIALSACSTLYKPVAGLNNIAFSSVLELPSTEPNEIIEYGADPQQRIWYWRASDAKSFKGVVMLVHGGCWLSQFDITHTKAMSSGLAAEGYVVWNIEYRRSGNGGEWPVALDDIKLAMSALQTHKGHQLDLSNINILGHSAGGHLALLAGSELAQLNLPQSSKVKVVGLAPIVDINAYALGENSCQTATPLFMGGMPEARAAEYQAANVLNRSFEQSLKVYSLSGGKDALVPVSFTQHPELNLRTVDEAGHFDWIHPGTEAFKLLLSILEH